MNIALKAAILAVSSLGTIAQANAAPFNVLWFDATDQFGGQSPNADRKEMSDSLTATPGNVFASTYVDGFAQPGALATALGAATYDVVVIDNTVFGTTSFNAADVAALQAFYANNNKNLLLDGSLYVRSLADNAGFPEFIYPGLSNSMDNFTRNQVHQLAIRGGGIFFGVDHNCCQAEINGLLGGILPGAAFSGLRAPNTSGSFYGTDLLVSIDPVAPLGILQHWSAEGSQGQPPVGNFNDFLGDPRTLYTFVDFPDFQGGRFPFVTASWQPGSQVIDIDDPDVPDPDPVPAPAMLLLFGLGVAGVALRRR